MDSEKVEIPQALIRALSGAEFVTVLTGAGISSESGVPTFRGKDGLWRKHNPTELATPEAFDRDPRLVWEWYLYRRGLMQSVRPNPAHMSIVELERRYSEFLLITQNVDDLHRKAGSTKLVELHGNIFNVRCSLCDRKLSELPETDELPPRCECGGSLRPDVVWFGEMLPQAPLEQAFEAAARCDCMLVVGTSAVVQPAASLPLVAKRAGAFVAELNYEPTPISYMADLSLMGKAGQLMPLLLRELGGISNTGVV